MVVVNFYCGVIALRNESLKKLNMISISFYSIFLMSQIQIIFL